MTNILLVLSKDPHTTEIPNLVLNIGLNAKTKKGIKILTDDKAVQSRGLDGRLIDGVKVKEIGNLLDHIIEDGNRVLR